MLWQSTGGGLWNIFGMIQDEKKRSVSTLENPEEDQYPLKGNEDRVKENHLRQKLLDDDPKCNIEKG